MIKINRYAVYFAPRPGPFADRAAAWLGWDAAAGRAVAQPDLPGLPVPPAGLTVDPRRYGFHGTIRAPFRPKTTLGQDEIAGCLSDLAAGLPAVICDGLALENLTGFLALTPRGDTAALLELAARVVEGTNDLRAPLTEAEIARRRPETLTVRQKGYLTRWGYPFVMDELRFHLTLTDRLPADQVTTVAAVLDRHFTPVLPRPFAIQDLCLFGEDETGKFHLLHRYALTG
ncbi:DUF1045 domain-containing protein [Paracoccus sp. 11-3]|uniref:DUF1045 domain-containing protein n=1 Tax=Paracoccus amoyensis TaxID=2760093 RepID=A0A926G6V0_9RHOB|nr:DUF1045 domain-containing protein [Paracoccus amoyensis]MBC9246898.1 DUF1045 domain-containing protein [Paracoccus amoyensis]